MLTISDLPPELLALVMAWLDQSSLKELRCTCHKLSAITARRLFGTIRLFPNEEGSRRLRAILKGDMMRACVQRIYLNATERDYVRNPVLFLEYCLV